MPGPTALLILANGAEDLETVVTVDILRRAGVAVTIAGLENGDIVKCSNSIMIKPDMSLCEAAKQKYEAIIMPGGLGGAKALAASAEVGKLLKEQEKAGKIIAAICAAPTVLKAHNIGLGKNVTSYPAMADEMKKDYKYSEDKVVIDGNVVTSRGPGTAYQFGMALAEKMAGADKAKQVAKGMLLDF